MGTEIFRHTLAGIHAERSEAIKAIPETITRTPEHLAAALNEALAHVIARCVGAIQAQELAASPGDKVHRRAEGVPKVYVIAATAADVEVSETAAIGGHAAWHEGLEVDSVTEDGIGDVLNVQCVSGSEYCDCGGDTGGSANSHSREQIGPGGLRFALNGVGVGGPGRCRAVGERVETTMRCAML